MDFKSSSQTSEEMGLKTVRSWGAEKEGNICLIQAALGKSLEWVAMYQRTLSSYKPLSTPLQVEASGNKA